MMRPGSPAALLLALGACGSSTTTAPPLQGSAAPPPASPAPSISWSADRFAHTGLPAVSNEGQTVVFWTSINDGGRGYPNLTLESRTRADAADQTLKVLSVDEYEAMVPETKPAPALEQRIAAGNQWLADLHRKLDLRPMRELVVDSTDRWTQHAAKLDDVTLDWQKDHLTIRRGAATLLSRDTPASWNAPSKDSCQNASKLGAAWIDVDRRVALVDVTYNGTDSCWEPSDQLHVVSW